MWHRRDRDGTRLECSGALMFGTSADPHSLMILTTATYFVVWLASYGVTWYGRRRPSPQSDADPGRRGDSREHDLPARPASVIWALGSGHDLGGRSIAMIYLSGLMGQHGIGSAQPVPSNASRISMISLSTS